MSKEQQKTIVIRIGSVPYLNSKVLTFGLKPSTPAYTFEAHVPSVLAQKLRAEEVDVALVSSIEYFRNPGTTIIPNISVSSHREIWSIQLFHRVPLHEAQRIALDPASETTNALLQVILHEKMKLNIELVQLQLGEDPMLREDIDGFLKIGDPCLLFKTPPGYQTLDLAAEWHEFTKLPFVFAVWVCRPGVNLQGINMELFMAKRDGLRNIDAISRTESRNLGIDYQRVKNYISRIVKYDLGREELGGMSLFRKYLVRQQMIEEGSGFDFYTR
ncbi:MAG: menaquinone biosynthesis protein [Planctomycetota bacterium]